MATDEATKARWTLAGIRVWTVVGIAVLAFAAVWLLSAMSFALVPLTLGMLIVLLLEGPVEFIARKTGRFAAVIICYLAAIVVLALAAWLILPPVIAQVVQFVQAAGGYVTQSYAWWQDNVMLKQTTPDSAWLRTATVALRDQLLAASGSLSTGVATFALSAGGWVMNFIFVVSIALMVAFYALADLPRLEREIFAIAGEKQREELAHALRTTSRVVGGWLTGTFVQSVIIAVMMTVGFMLLGVPYAIVLGLLGGLLNPVPYVGPAISWVIAALAGLIVGPWTALWAFVVAWAASNINGVLLAPRIMSDSVDLHPLVVLASLLIGTALFGLPGVIFAVPVAAVAKGMLLYRYEKRTAVQLGSEDGVLFRASATDCAEDACDHDREQAQSDISTTGTGDRA